MKRYLVALVSVFCAAGVSAAGVCDVTAYGAKNDASARATKAIHDAIQACAANGGGTVYFPPGTYETGAIELRPATSLSTSTRARRCASTPIFPNIRWCPAGAKERRA